MEYGSQEQVLQQYNTQLSQLAYAEYQHGVERARRGGEKKKSRYKAKKRMKMPRIFRYLIYIALVLLIWKAVLNAEGIVSYFFPPHQAQVIHTQCPVVPKHK